MWTEKPPRRRTYLWQRPDWPRWRWDAAALATPLAQVHRAQGHLAGRMSELGKLEGGGRNTAYALQTSVPSSPALVNRPAIQAKSASSAYAVSASSYQTRSNLPMQAFASTTLRTSICWRASTAKPLRIKNGSALRLT